MKKSCLVLVLALIMLMPGVFAEELPQKIVSAYTCFETKAGDDCGSGSTLEQVAFTLMAGGYDSSINSDCKNALKSFEGNNCYKSGKTGNCDIRSTALAVIAKSYLGLNVDKEIDWLEAKDQLAGEFEWYIEIDSDNETECIIKVNGGSQKSFDIRENKKIIGSSSCLSPAEGSYFLKIDSDCLDDNFTISCDQNFITSVFYKVSGSPIIHISSNSHSQTALGETLEFINAYCFGDNKCNYKESLWATWAFKSAGEEFDKYLPYISALADESQNKEYLPHAFLYILTHEGEYYSQLMAQQKNSQYWDVSNQGKLYDTSFAVLGIDSSDSVRDSAKEFFLENQGSDNCFGSLRDTAMVLFSAWPKSPISSGGDDTTPSCTAQGYNNFCVPTGTCNDPLENFVCFGGKECCAQDYVTPTCSAQNGTICEEDEFCDGDILRSSNNGECCSQPCTPNPTNACEDNSYNCKSFCSDEENEVAAYEDDCGGYEVCCKPKEGGANWILIILLIMLIILVILAIIFREQLKIWLFKTKSRFKKQEGPKPTNRPMMPPPTPNRQMPRQIIPRPSNPQPRPSQAPPQRRNLPNLDNAKKAQKDKDFEETMRRLRDLSKK